MNRKAVDTWQGVVALVGITLGVIPLATTVLGIGEGGLWGRLVGDALPAWLLPLLTTVVAGFVVLVLERRKAHLS